MKVLHLISGGDEGGAKTHVITLLKELDQHIDITLVCLLDGEFAREAISAGINTKIFKQEKRYDLSIVNKLVEVLKKDFDILHCHGARANFLSMLINKKYKIPTVSTIHSDYRSDFDNNLYKKIIYTTLNYFSLRRIDYYIAITKQFKQMLIDRKFNKRKIFVAYNGIEINEAEVLKTKKEFLETYHMKYEEHCHYVGIVTRLHPVKGIPVFLKAAKKVLKSNKNVKFIIAGDGEKKYKEQYLNFVNQNQLQGHIIFIGYVKDIKNFYNLIDINVLTSHSESFPYALLEGGLQKKATISSAVGGIPEMMEHNRTGMLFTDKDDTQLAKYIQELLVDKDKINKLGNALYHNIVNNFSNINMGRTHLQIYNKIRGNHYDK